MQDKLPWENGSEFHLVYPDRSDDEAKENNQMYWLKHGVFFSSGRGALKFLLEFGQNNKAWKRLWIPSYYCFDIVDYLTNLHIEILFYPDSPLNGCPDLANLSFVKGDVLLYVNYFGLRKAPNLDFLRSKQVEVIEDHTHDPYSLWANNSSADWCFASLRKTVPIPDGGVLWSLKNKITKFEPKVANDALSSSLKKFGGMFLKKMYLENRIADKNYYLDLLRQGEQEIASVTVSAITPLSYHLLELFPLLQWRKRRRDNFISFQHAITKMNELVLLQSEQENDMGICAFSCVIIFASKLLCEHCYNGLIQDNIYPAKLWPVKSRSDLPNLPEMIDLSERLLSLHCDMRYCHDDMLKVATKIRSCCDSFAARG